MAATLDQADADANADLDVPVNAWCLARTAPSSVGAGMAASLRAIRPRMPKIVAIRQAARCWRLDGCTLVVTLKLCTVCGSCAGRTDRAAGLLAADARARAAKITVGRGARLPMIKASR